MKQIKFLFLLLMLLVGVGSYAQTSTVEFVAGTDKGKNSKTDWKGKAGEDQVQKDGVTMYSNNALFAADKYLTKDYVLQKKELKFSCAKMILNVKFEGGENLSKLSANGFDADKKEWSGKATEVTFTVSGEVKFSKAIVTVQDKYPTTLSFAQETADVVMGNTYTYAATLKSGNDELADKTVSYTSQNPDVATVDNTGKLTLLKRGTAVIKATFAGDADYEAAEATLTLNVTLQPTTLTFVNPTAFTYFELNQKPIFPVLLKNGDTELTGKSIRFESSDQTVATISEDGVVTPLSLGSTTIKAIYDGDATYEAAEAETTFNVVDGKNIFYESFDNMDKRGGNDGEWNFLEIGTRPKDEDFDNLGWTDDFVIRGAYVYNASKCARLEMSSSLTTPALANLSGDAFLTFRAGQVRGIGDLELSISGGGSLAEKTVKLENGHFNDYLVVVKDATPETKITFKCSSGGAIFLDDVKIERAIVLNEATDNARKLDDNNGVTVDVAVERPLSPDYWNTFSLPFALDADHVADIFGEGTKLKEFDRWDADEQTLYFKDATEILAGMPYLIKPAEQVEDILLTDADIYSGEVTSGNTGVEFCAALNTKKLAASDVFLGTDGYLYHPDTETEGADQLKGFRAYFTGLTDLTNAKVNIDGTVTAISAVNGGAEAKAKADNKVYTIGGQYVGATTRGLAKGIYMVNGKKFVVK